MFFSLPESECIMRVKIKLLKLLLNYYFFSHGVQNVNGSNNVIVIFPYWIVFELMIYLNLLFSYI